MSTTSRRPSAALIVSMVALVAALAGSAVALPGKNTVDKNDIKKNAVRSKAIKNGQVKAADIKDGAVGAAEIADGSVGGAELADPEAVHLTGAAGEPTFDNGGDGDCVWQNVSASPSPSAAAFAPVGFYKDADGRVHLSGSALSEDSSGGDAACGDDGGDDGDRDGVVFVLPSAYRPASTEVFFPNGFGTFGAAVIGQSDLVFPGTDTVPAGSVVINLDDPPPAGDLNIGALGGISFRAAAGAARSSAREQVTLPGGSLFP